MRAAPIFLGLSFVFALIFGQIPEFTQQSAQRLGGAVDELARIVEHFDADSTLSGYSRSAALTLMANSSEHLVRDQAARMRESISRLDQLRGQQTRLATGGWFARSVGVLADLDPQVARGTLAAFEPALPRTLSGLICAALGFVLAYAGLSLGARALAAPDLSARHA